MAEVVNLRMARKAKKRQEAQAQAATNRALHGRTKAQKQADALEKTRVAKLLDGAKRES
ncbi:DUF4169 family protein [Sphingobium sp. DEHP117]|uniref:DUF4169 family protein n=1 Tax=Sphingobium sp. DEHP117 TaxID=2993436 RepID=UPI0027D67AC8|nr:DUF4169 family protein [Sphingobium sp. DEHP117]MDQ4421777.1 DUF4169 family protein [Sphingobium sp. DEHP117]